MGTQTEAKHEHEMVYSVISYHTRDVHKLVKLLAVVTHAGAVDL